MTNLKVSIAAAIIIVSVAFLLSSCGDKYPLPATPKDQNATLGVDDTTYIQQYPDWDADNGFNLSAPTDILVGNEPYLYIADSANNRILMLDLNGNRLGSSQPIPGPTCVSQDGRLNLVVVCNTNKIYKIDLYSVQHNITAAEVKLVYEDVDHPNRQFTSVAAWHGTQSGSVELEQWYYVTVNGPDKRDNAIFYFSPMSSDEDALVGPINMEPNGTGMFSTATPCGITITKSFNGTTGYFDFLFSQKGENFYKVQWITSNVYGFAIKLNPATSPTDIFTQGKFSAPEDVTIDEQGNIFVVDARQHRLFKFNSSGLELQSFGELGDGEKQFHRPMGVAYFDKTVYVADTGNDRILRFKLSTDIQ